MLLYEFSVFFSVKIVILTVEIEEEKKERKHKVYSVSGGECRFYVFILLLPAHTRNNEKKK